MIDKGHAQRLREKGWTLQAIGDELGCSRERIRQITTPVAGRTCVQCGSVIDAKRPNARYCSRGCANRASNRRRLSPCIDCGAPVAGDRCTSCKRAQWERERIDRYDRLKALWDQGLSMREIAVKFGTTENALGVWLHRARAAGWDLPLRRVGRKTDGLTKRQSREQFSQAIRAGEIRRPTRCEGCGDVGPVDGHHHDYNRPLYVEWLCPSCHRDVHRETAA